MPPFGFAPVQFVDVFPRTPDQKVHLLTEALEQEAPLGLYTWQDDPATAQVRAKSLRERVLVHFSQKAMVEGVLAGYRNAFADH